MTFRNSAVLLALLLTFLIAAIPACADEPLLKPFVLASYGPGSIETRLEEIKSALIRRGFQPVGEYSPYKGAYIVVVTSEALKTNAAKSEFGAFGAAMRISLTERGKELQVAYTNPLYFAQAYNMGGTLSDVANELQGALGKKEDFGSKDGLKAGALRKYHYMVMMPYFNDRIKLASFGSQEKAIRAVEAGLDSAKSGVSRVYRVDVPGKNESVIGVEIKSGEGADSAIMKVIDFADTRQTAHLPYELVVSDGSVYMLHGKFRIALDFPDLTMGTFMKISGAPAAIEAALKQAVSGK